MSVSVGVPTKSLPWHAMFRMIAFEQERLFGETQKRSLQGPGDGMRCRLHASHEEDTGFAPHAGEGQQVALPFMQLHEVVAYRGVLLKVSLPPAGAEQLVM